MRDILAGLEVHDNLAAESSSTTDRMMSQWKDAQRPSAITIGQDEMDIPQEYTDAVDQMSDTELKGMLSHKWEEGVRLGIIEGPNPVRKSMFGFKDQLNVIESLFLMADRNEASPAQQAILDLNANFAGQSEDVQARRWMQRATESALRDPDQFLNSLEVNEDGTTFFRGGGRAAIPQQTVEQLKQLATANMQEDPLIKKAKIEAERTKQMNARKLDTLNKYPDVYGSIFEEDFAVGVGRFGKVLASPETLIAGPAGFAAKTATLAKAGTQFTKAGAYATAGTELAMFGGSLGAVDSVINQLAEKGEVDTREVAVMSGMGALAAPLLVGGVESVKALSGLLRGKLAAREGAVSGDLGVDPTQLASAKSQAVEASQRANRAAATSRKLGDQINVTDAEVKKLVNDLGLENPETINTKVLADQINEQLNIVAPMSKVTKAERQAALDKTFLDPENNFWTRYSETLESAKTSEELAKALSRGDSTTAEAIFQNVVNRNRGRVIPKSVVQDINRIKKEVNDETWELVGVKPQQAGAAEAQELVDDHLTTLAIMQRNVPTEAQRSLALERIMKEAEQAPLSNKEMFKRYLEGVHKEKIAATRKRLAQLKGRKAFVDKKVREFSSQEEALWRIYDDIDNGVGTVPNQFREEVHMAKAMAEESMEDAAMLQERAAKGEVKLESEYSPTNTSTVDAFQDNLWKGLRSPAHVMRKYFGPAGKQFTDRMEGAYYDFKVLAGSMSSRIDDVWSKLDDVEKAVLRDSLQGKKVPLNAKLQGVRAVTRQELNNVVRKGVEAGLIDANLGSKLMSNDTYFPRMYDHDYLSSPEGVQHFIEKLSTSGWSNKQAAEDAVRHILHEGDGNSKKYIGYLKEITTKSGEVRYVMPRQMARELLTSMRANTHASRRSSLENARKLKVDDDVLNDFMIKDPLMALHSYINTSARRISFASKFGVNDEHAMQWFKAIDETSGKQAAQYAQRMYWTAVGDAKSPIVAASADMSDSARRWFGGVNAMMAMKLTLAPFWTLGSVPANLSTKLLQHTNSYAHMHKVARRAMSTLTDTETNTFLKEAGIAYENTMIELMGSQAAGHSIAGKSLEQAWKGKGAAAHTAGKVLDKFQIPANFMRLIGHTQIDSAGRMFTGHFGAAHIDIMTNELMRVRSLGNRASKGEIKKAAQYTKALEELKLSTKPEQLGKWSRDQRKRAVLMFSDIVNHKNGPLDLPESFRTPMGKLIMKFKPFLATQHNFIRDNVMTPLIKDKNPLPALNYFGLMGMVYGLPMSALLNVMRGDDREYSNTQRTLQALAFVGGLGIWADMGVQMSTARDPGTAMLGPLGGDIAKLAKASGRVVKPIVTGDEAPSLDDLQNAGVDVLGLMSPTLPYKKQLLDSMRAIDQTKRIAW